ncbi:hypothetical protein NKG05_13640 [Oerskovia sp. M15]
MSTADATTTVSGEGRTPAARAPRGPSRTDGRTEGSPAAARDVRQGYEHRPGPRAEALAPRPVLGRVRPGPAAGVPRPVRAAARRHAQRSGGRAAGTLGGSVWQWFVPSILVMTTLFGTSTTGANLQQELNTGAHERMLVSRCRGRHCSSAERSRRWRRSRRRRSW